MILLSQILLFHELFNFPRELGIMHQRMRSVSIVMWGQKNPKDLSVMKSWSLNHRFLRVFPDGKRQEFRSTYRTVSTEIQFPLDDS